MVTRAEGVVASVDGVIADVISRRASIDGALEQEGEAEFTLAGDVYFECGSAVLVPRAAADPATVAAQVREAGVPALDVVGHTDSVGSDADNLALSQARAAAIVAALQPRLPGVTWLRTAVARPSSLLRRRPRTVRTTRSRGR